MSYEHPCENIDLINKFSIHEKIVLGGLLYGMIAIGAIGIFIQDITWGCVYAVMSLCVMVAVVLPLLCARCPYPFLYGDCLFMPKNWIKRFYNYKTSPMSYLEVTLLTISLAALVALPQVWLIRQWILLGFFWLCAIPLLLVFPGYYCRRCRHARCPFNCVKKVSRHPMKNEIKG